MKREILVTKHKTKYRVICGYDAYLVSVFRSIGDMLFNNIDKCYYTNAISILKILNTFKESQSYSVRFADADFQMEDFFNDVKELQRKEIEKVESRKNNVLALEEIEKEENLALEFKDAVKPNVNLYHYQAVAVKYMSLLKSGLLALVPGLGKTLVSIVYAEHNKIDKVLVICSNSLKHNFRNEVEKFTNSKAYIIKGTKSVNKYPIEECKYFIVNYEYFAKKLDKYDVHKDPILNELPKFGLVILDESHRIKNTKSNTYKNIKKFITPIERKLFLSGTPAPNRIHELYSVLNLINPEHFPSKTKYYMQYCGMVYDKTRYGWVEKEKVDLDKLFNDLRAFSYRKRKEDVLDLPPKKIIPVLNRLTNKEQKEYNALTIDILRDIEERPTMRDNTLTQMQKLRQYTANYKFKMVTDLINQILESGEKVVVIDLYKKTLFQLREYYLQSSVLHTGDETPEARAYMVKQFQEDFSIKVFLGTASTAKEGITLTAANNMIIITQPYSVGEDEQIQDRIHRIGQNNSVNIYYPIVEKTIDDSVYYLIENKKKKLLKAIDNIDYENKGKRTVMYEVLRAMQEKYNKRYSKNED